MPNVMSYDRPSGTGRPEFSIPSIIAIIAAIGSFFVGAGLGMLLAVIAIAAGAIGVLLALSPRVRGGIVSVMSILFGVVGIIAAVIKVFVH